MIRLEIDNDIIYGEVFSEDFTNIYTPFINLSISRSFCQCEAGVRNKFCRHVKGLIYKYLEHKQINIEMFVMMLLTRDYDINECDTWEIGR